MADMSSSTVTTQQGFQATNNTLNKSVRSDSGCLTSSSNDQGDTSSKLKIGVFSPDIVPVNNLRFQYTPQQLPLR